MTTFRYLARRGDTLGDLAREFRQEVSLLQELNPDLDPAGPIAPGHPILLPWREPTASLRIRGGGSTLIQASSIIRVSWEAGWHGPPVLPLYTFESSRSLRLRLVVERSLSVGEGVVRGLVFLAPGGAFPVDSLPTHAYAGQGNAPLLHPGGPTGKPLPGLEEMRSEVEGAGGVILREIAERGRAGEQGLAAAFFLTHGEILDRVSQGGTLRLWALLTDGYACDADRTDAVGVLRLLVEYPLSAPGEPRSRSVVEVGSGESDYRETAPVHVGGERAVLGDGDRAVELLPCPAAGRLRVTTLREGTLGRCTRDGDLSLELSSGFVPTEQHPMALQIFYRETGEPPCFWRISPEGERVTPEEYDQERHRLDPEIGHLTVLLEIGSSGLRLVEAWLDGEAIA